MYRNSLSGLSVCLPYLLQVLWYKVLYLSCPGLEVTQHEVYVTELTRGEKVPQRCPSLSKAEHQLTSAFFSGYPWSPARCWHERATKSNLVPP